MAAKRISTTTVRGQVTIMKFPRLVLITALATALAKLALVWSGLPEKSLVCDDAYYYFTIATNLAHGQGPTFDGLAPTNGFHPLWQLIVTPLFRLAPEHLWLPVRLALSLTVVCDLISGLLIFRILGARTGTRLAAGAAVGWCVFAPTALIGLRGMEASVSTLLLLVLLRYLAGRDATAPGDSVRSAVAAGLLVGLCGWARTDNLVAAGVAVAVALFWRGGPRRYLVRLGHVGAAAAAALVVMLPWFAWNLIEFGSIVQVSGQVKLAVSDLFGHLPWGWWSFQSGLITVLNMLFPSVMVTGVFLAGEEFDGGGWALPLGVITVLGILAILARAAIAARTGGRAGHRPCVVFAATWLVVHTVLYGFVWRSYASWYAHGYFALLIVLLATLLGAGGFDTRFWRRFAVGAVAAVACAQLACYPLFFSRLVHHARGPEKQFDGQLQRVLAMQPQGAALGAFDAGGLGYVALKYPAIRVVNIDGLVNNEIFAASRRGRYVDYVIEHVDFLVQAADRASMFVGPAEVERLQRHFGQR